MSILDDMLYDDTQMGNTIDEKKEEKDGKEGETITSTITPAATMSAHTIVAATTTTSSSSSSSSSFDSKGDSKEVKLSTPSSVPTNAANAGNECSSESNTLTGPWYISCPHVGWTSTSSSSSISKNRSSRRIAGVNIGCDWKRVLNHRGPQQLGVGAPPDIQVCAKVVIVLTVALLYSCPSLCHRV
jgi:hypothetical protein